MEWKEIHTTIDATFLKNNNTKAASFTDEIGNDLDGSCHYIMCSSSDLLRKPEDVSLLTKKAARLERLATDVSTDSTPKEMPRKVDWNDILSILKSFSLLVFTSVFVLEFSLWFPFVIPGVASAALKTYIPASYRYDHELSRFDNTPWTYNTDYLLTVVMSYLACKCLMANAPDGCRKKNRSSLPLRLYSASLLICYAISTLAGGWAHQHFTSIDSLNTIRFRMFWIVCVGNVSFASCYMGLIAREVQKTFGVKGAVPLGPWWFWPAYGSYMAVACALGYISFKRPACDIFIAGITQFPTTVYCLLALGLRRWPPSSSSKMRKNGDSSKQSPVDLVRLRYRVMYYIGFIGNAPLLPMYPLLVQYSGMSLAGINTLLHTWLMVMWGMQGISLLHLCKAISTCEPRALVD